MGEKKEKELEAETKAEEKLEARHNDKDAKEIEELKAKIKELESEIKVEKVDIEKVKEEIKEDEEKIETEKKAFCDDCRFFFNGLSTTCGLRKNFLMSRYKNTEEAAVSAVVKWDPN